ncbi:MAG: nucleotidyltransferase domain-containing protein [Patescibacteria group bacterium]|nr:nucleotidyltransferase domain-containing protein [Patescibacteria group bacterium]
MMRKKRQFNIAKILKNFFGKKKEVLFCYLFGSLAYQNFTKKSDVDLAVYLDEKKCKDFFEKRLELISQISPLLKKEADIVVLNTAPLFLKYVILQEGKLIFERDKGKRIDFELKIVNEYFDFKPILEKYRQRLLSG